METKLLYVVGNLYTGTPWGVAAERQFGTTELHGPFSTENEANTYAHKLADKLDLSEDNPMPYRGIKVVRLETPKAGAHIVRKYGVLQYAATP